MSGAPTPDPFAARQLQALSRLVSRRVAESVRWPQAEHVRNLRLAKTVAVGGVYPEEGDTFAIRFMDLAFSPLATGSTHIAEQERTAENDTDDAPDQIGREINGKYIPEGSYVAALWQRGVAGSPATYGEWWLRWPTGPNPDPDPNCDCYLIFTTGECGPGTGGAPSIWRLTTSSFADADCSDCEVWNGDFELCYKGYDKWESAAYDGTECSHTAGDPLWRLTRNATSGNYELRALGLGYWWRKSIATWQCTSDNILSRFGPVLIPDPCTGVPATVTLKPCMYTCPICADQMPSPISVTFDGLVDELCEGCDSFNATHVLEGYRGCFWRVTGTFACAPSGITPSYGVDAWVDRDSLTGYMRLWVLLSLGASIWPSIRSHFWYYVYNSRSGNLLDCTGSYVLTYDHGNDADLCRHLPPPTCLLLF